MTPRIAIEWSPIDVDPPPLPLEYAHPGDAGLDLRAYIPLTASDDVADDPEGRPAVLLAAGQRALVGTGIRIALPLGYCGLVIPRSGLALERGLTVLNAPGLIDAGYRGEVGVILVNLSDEEQRINHGDRIAQLVIAPTARADFIYTGVLPDSPRGQSGFGSTGTD